jgi:hypothetical protein
MAPSQLGKNDAAAAHAWEEPQVVIARGQVSAGAQAPPRRTGLVAVRYIYVGRRCANCGMVRRSTRKAASPTGAGPFHRPCPGGSYAAE